MNAIRPKDVRTAVAPTGAATALALLLGACGGGDPAVETSTIELESDPVAVPADPADPAPADPAASVDAGAVGETAGELADDALAVGTEAVDAAAAGADETWTSLKENWSESAADVQAHFGELSEEDVLSTGGDRQALVSVVQERYRLDPDEAERQVADWEATL